MEDADKWILSELTDLRFGPYGEILPKISRNFELLRTMEASFRDEVGNRLTKRQAVALGLLARSFQLSVSCLLNQLLQNYAGWHCSYRSLMETFFVVDWALQDPQRLEAYFEGNAPGIGRIKTECCGRHPEFASKYEFASEVTHVGNRALHLPRLKVIHTPEALPFAVTFMTVAGAELANMLNLHHELMDILGAQLKALLAHAGSVATGEVLWDGTESKSKFGCLGYEPKRT